ncbi:hypothetical protein EJP67_18540 [Variovorax guangxiensis]|uniref:Uncharacterized protein n=1 Tax=Variovorax guangxiensis TaxID=1775474 RepID=A0A433MNJ7_9BURK|nr:hypothetical protein [Variovorax guangxiensis]RUR69060.1 hypothetical protein EJP67_18540 [Variovorax guangxiensis]
MNSVVLSGKLRQQARIGRRRLLKFDESGNRIGESNPAAILSDHEVELMLELRRETGPDGRPAHSYLWLAEKFEVSRETVRSICTGRRRACFVARTAMEAV